jgi:hypothetical protein
MKSIDIPEGTGERTYNYAALQIKNPDFSKVKCRDLAGFSPYYPPSAIEATQRYQDIRQKTLQAAESTGVTPEAVFNTLKRSMDRSKVDRSCDGSANQAAKIAGEFIGMSAPVQINTNVQQQTNILLALLPQ